MRQLQAELEKVGCLGQRMLRPMIICQSSCQFSVVSISDSELATEAEAETAAADSAVVQSRGAFLFRGLLLGEQLLAARCAAAHCRGAAFLPGQRPNIRSKGGSRLPWTVDHAICHYGLLPGK